MENERVFYEIKGTVRGHGGAPVRLAHVTLWWRHIRARKRLAESRTSDDGRYHLRYELPKEPPQPVLIEVEVELEGLTPVKSPLREAQRALEIDLDFEPQDVSRWSGLLQKLAPLLEGLKLTDLVENANHQDLSFLAKETGEASETLMQVALSARLEALFLIPAPVFFAFLSQRVPPTIPSPLLDASDSFTLIDALVQNIASLIFALTPGPQTTTLTAAVETELIGPQFAKQIPELVNQLQSRRVTNLLNQPFSTGNVTLAQILDVVALAKDKQAAFSQALANNDQRMRDFWRELKTGKLGISASDAASIQRALSLGALVKNHIPLLRTLEAQFVAGKYTALSQLATLSKADWVALVKDTGPPANIDAAGDADPVEVFASVVYARVTRAYPTLALSSRVSQSAIVPAQEREPLTHFFRNNSDLELLRTNLAVYLEQKGSAAFEGIDADQRPAVLAHARTFQRVLRVAPTVDAAQSLLTVGIRSAAQIANLGRQQFFERATAIGFTKREANQAYAVAAHRYARVVTLYMQMNREAIGIWPKAIGDFSRLADPIDNAITRDQSLATLFGSQDYCAIEDCTSVLSPAAYLCDLLLWLRNHPQGGHTALDVLDGRRPDIRQLLLNCPNTDIELPYIDLVNELLADKISPPTDPSSTINPIFKQTTEGATTAQLRAAPEYFNQQAFVTLFSAFYPQTLPYSAGLDELRTYLQHWNLPLWQLRQALLPLSGGTTAQQAAVAAERLGMNTQAESLVTIPNFITSAQAWNVNDFTSGPNGLASVPVFLSASFLKYDSLLELLESTWVQGGLGIKLTGLNDTCDTSEMALSPAPLDPGFLDRAHRFLRLWIATGYKMWEQDLLLEAPSVGAGVLNQQTLVNLQAFWEVQKQTRLAVNQLLAFYQDIDTKQHRDPDGTITRSLYEQVFLNPTVTWIAPDPDLVQLPSGGAIGDVVLSDHVKAIQPALGVSAADMAMLFSLTNNQLTLSNLSLIYRVNALAKVSKYSLSSLLTVARLLNPTALTPVAALAPLFASPADTLNFLSEAVNVQKSSLSLDATTYLLTPPAPVVVGASTTLTAAITSAQTTITVASDAGFPAPSFYIQIGSEILLVTGVSGAGNTTWTVVRGQQGTAAASASIGAVVKPAGNGGWNTTTQMTLTNIASALVAVQQAIMQLLSASTALAANITATDTTITVSNDTGFPAAPFSVYIGSEILQVTGVSGAGNTTWTVLRGQQGTTAAAAAAGAAVTPTSGDLDGAVIAAVAANAHPTGGSALANDVSALILKGLQVPGTGKALIAVLEDPAFVAPVGTITISGTPAAGDRLQTTLNPIAGAPVTVTYTLVAGDAGDVNQTAIHFAQAINASPAITGPTAFLASATASGAVITLTSLTPFAPGSNVTSNNSTTPGGAAHVAVSPDVTVLNSAPAATQAAFPDQFLAIQLFDKVAVLVRGLKLVVSDLSWLLDNAAVYGGLDFAQLPVAPTQAAVNLTLLLTTLLLIKLARTFTAAAQTAPVRTLYDLISGVNSGSLATEAQAQSALAGISGWPLADIEAFAPPLALAFPLSYKQPATYAALRTLETMSSAVNGSGPVAPAASTTLTAAITGAQTSITVASAIGFPAPNFYINIGAEILLVTAVSGADNTTWTVLRGQQGSTASAATLGAAVTPTYGAQIVTWGSVPADEISAESLAASALGVLKAQQLDETSWVALAPALMNPIRERRSAALQAYLIGQRDGSGKLIYGDANGLFDYFLIDVKMTSCQTTSRVVQAYVAVQIFVERCLMNLETTMWNSASPGVVVDLTKDDTWVEWQWMKRYRVWEANREVFLYPENWLIESERPSRTEIYQKLEQEVHQGQSTADYLQTVALNYVDRLDGLAHLQVTGTASDPSTGTIYVVGRSLTDPPVFYLRSLSNGVWTGWKQITLDIKAHQAIPAVYAGRVCVFWIEIKVANEPKPTTPSAQATTYPVSNITDRYVSIGVNFSIFRNGSWSPVQAAKGKLFDKPIFDPTKQAGDAKTIEALYTLKVQRPPATPGYGTALFLDVFRLGEFNVKNMYNEPNDPMNYEVTGIDESKAVHLGRGVFNGHFSDLELNNMEVPGVYPDNFLESGVGFAFGRPLLSHAKSTYGPDAQPLIPLSPVEPDLTGESGLSPVAGALAAFPDATHGSTQTLQLNFHSLGGLEQNSGPLVNRCVKPLRIVGPSSDLSFDPTSYFFFQDSYRCYYVDVPKYYWNGSFFSPVIPSDPNTVPFELIYRFHPFYHPFTRLIWNQLGAGGFDLLYDPRLQQAPDRTDPSYADVFSFQDYYQPTWRVQWDLASVTTTLAAPITSADGMITVTNDIWIPEPTFLVRIGSEILQVTAAGGTDRTAWTVLRGQQGTAAAAAAKGAVVTPLPASQDRQFLDFGPSAAFSVYNWELFYHIPLYIAQMLSQNQQFEDSLKWFHYIFNPTRQSSDPVPERFWITKPFHDLTSDQILQQQIERLLTAVNHGDPDAVAQIQSWRRNPFNPFALADLRPVAYMKSTVMSYLDNLIAWADNLFASESREALSEATLIYVIAAEILGPTPSAITPPPHADKSYDQLEPSLDAFANAMVDIENVVGPDASVIQDAGPNNGNMPAPQTFYFKIPSNPKLLAYWTTVADRLNKLRHCQNIAGGALQLALFDAPIDPGLLIAAQAAGVDLSSVLTDLGAALPNYRFTALYTQALDFVNAVRAYGSAVQAALEKTDAGALALLQQTLQQQLLADGDDVAQWQVDQAQKNLDALQEALNLAQQKATFNHSQNLANAAEIIGTSLHTASGILKIIAATTATVGAAAAIAPDFTVGAAGFGGSPVAVITDGGTHAARAGHTAGFSLTTLADILEIGAGLSNTIGSWQHRKDNWDEAANEADIQIKQTQAQIDAATLALQIAQQNQQLHQEQIDNIQKQIDFLNDKFTSNSLYDWMVGSLAATYFQSYQLAYRLCKQVERCYQFELAIQNSSFIQFGYWDSLHKGLLAGETLNHDLRRMQASYLQQNARRFELSRFISLATLAPGGPATSSALENLLVNGFCDFDIPESLFDNDYPGHYNRRLTRVSVTVVYPSPGKFDNVKATLTLVANKVRVKTDTDSGYEEDAGGSDPRFIYNFAANSQKIAMGNAQDDPGLFVSAIASNIADQRYLPFENAGAISSWHLEMQQLNNEVDLGTVGDVVLHLYYTALDGGSDFRTAVEADLAANLPSSGTKIFSALNDFAAPAPTVANPYPVTPWQAFLVTGAAQMLTLSISPSKFPPWTRGKTITVSSVTVLAVAWPPGNFVLVPQSPLPTAALTLTPVAGVTEPNVCAGTIVMPPNSPLGTWNFQLQRQGAPDFQSLSRNQISDVILVVNFDVA